MTLDPYPKTITVHGVKAHNVCPTWPEACSGPEGGSGRPVYLIAVAGDD